MTVENAILHVNEEEHNESISCTIDGQYWSVPLREDNRHYQLVLDAIIEQGADCWEGDIPTELQTAADAKLFAQQLMNYTQAMARLEHYIVADGREEVTEEYVTGQVFDEETEEMVDVTETRVVLSAISPVEPTITVLVENRSESGTTTEVIENPLITKDNEQRAEAQAVVDSTPQAVIDTYNE